MTNDQSEQTRRLFDSLAETYDSVGVDFFQPIAEQLVTELAPATGEAALDVGCGRGAVLRRLGRAVGPTGRAKGIDLSPRMVEATASDLAVAGPAAEVVVGDAQRLDLGGESFDVVASSLVLFFLSDPVAALRSWRGCLVAGGRLGVSTFGRVSPSWEAVDAVFAPYLPEDMVDPRTPRSGNPFGSDAGVEEMVSAAGYVQVRTTTGTVPVRFEDEEQWYRWTWSVGQRRMWQLVPESMRDEVRAEATRRLQLTRDAAGRIGFDQVVRYTLARNEPGS